MITAISLYNIRSAAVSKTSRSNTVPCKFVFLQRPGLLRLVFDTAALRHGADAAPGPFVIRNLASLRLFAQKFHDFRDGFLEAQLIGRQFQFRA